jgi:hypothetical protein
MGEKPGLQLGSVLVHEGGAAVRSCGGHLAQHASGAPVTSAGWVACAMYHAASTVTHLNINGRLIAVPEHSHVLVVWKAPPCYWPPCHPHVVAVGHDGTRLAEFGPSDRLGSHAATLAETPGQ